MRLRPPSMREKLAAAMLEIQRLRGDPIAYDHARGMSPEMILSLYQCDHYPVRMETAIELGWSAERVNHPTNLDFKLIRDHRVKTSKRDIPEIAKGKKVIAANLRHAERMTAKDRGETVSRQTTRWPKGRKMQSRPFQKGHRPLRTRT